MTALHMVTKAVQKKEGEHAFTNAAFAKLSSLPALGNTHQLSPPPLQQQWQGVMALQLYSLLHRLLFSLHTAEGQQKERTVSLVEWDTACF
jgi:hypothetical protein